MLLEVQYAHVLSDTIRPIANTNTNSMGNEFISVRISGNNCIHIVLDRYQGISHSFEMHPIPKM